MVTEKMDTQLAPCTAGGIGTRKIVIVRERIIASSTVLLLTLADSMNKGTLNLELAWFDSCYFSMPAESNGAGMLRNNQARSSPILVGRAK